MENVQWEKKPLIEIAKDKQLMAYKHKGFWKCMDAIRDKVELEEIWDSGKAPWKVWE
jgi:glucose-1-phosphate cytidylyltransferase